ncbi:haloacid dehalogenase [Thiobaca trueperi]|uniref:Hydroxymethylpyrimidine pyrophosphatase-like HAD family hydrolase n=1 Tax=Thiobaca trueperi TaxID=127458 RepID=A0A4R3MU23_9GAMM|nr:haloacid dehalogenase [Thiobaca trueperi]TCT19585.1 hydroxymethylpyrimidine pyrophosphatase-like HAD family hydrolase [Thiobaca trueperi]
MRTLVFVDLDDTLFQSRHKCPTDDDLHPVASLRDGSVHSFMTAKQRALWRLLDADATLIPTTARDLDSLRRVDLPFQSWRILDYGGVILNPDGHPDAPWMQRMTQVSQETIGELNALLDLVETFIQSAGLSAHVRIIEDFGLPFYLVAKYRDDREDDLSRLQDELVRPWLAERADAYRLHRNGNNLAVLPRALGKEHAVRYLIEHLGRENSELLTIGVGDSLIDGAFMAECDYAITPRGSQLFEATLQQML